MSMACNPYMIYTSNTFFTTASFVTSEGEHVPNWPQIMPKLRRFWEEYAKYPINFQESIGNDGDILRRVINEDVLREFNEWQSTPVRMCYMQLAAGLGLRYVPVSALGSSTLHVGMGSVWWSMSSSRL